MKKRTGIRHDSQVRSNDVCTKHSDTWDVTDGGKRVRLALNGYVTESTRLLAVRQRAVVDRRAATEQCRLCRRALRALGAMIVRVGKLVHLPDTAMDTLTVARSMSDAALQARMQGLHDRVLPYRDAFEAEGLPPDALTRLTAAIHALADARAAYASTIQEAAAAEEALHENQKRARLTILALESVAPTATSADREVVTKLQVARRVGPRTIQAANEEVMAEG